jgi:hypothetical protein
MIEIQPPTPLTTIDFDDDTLFLGGSIEMGTAVDWQRQLCTDLNEYPLVVLNPRRADWDAAWKQSIDNPVFNEQVTWELDALDCAKYVVFYFDPATKSPITLMELGIQAEQQQYANSDKTVIVCCPEGFWRKGNVDILCERYGIQLVDSYPKLVEAIKNELNNF